MLSVNVDDPWRAWHPRDAAAAFADVPVDWWFAGGWAIDLFVGRETRAHADLDIGCFRDDVDRLRSSLADWAFFEAADGRLGYVEVSDPTPARVSSYWARPAESRTWHIQIMIEDRTGSLWTFRRDPSIIVPAAELVQSTAGFRVLRPEIQLLYKAKNTRERDHADFGHAAPLLGAQRRIWLARALRQQQSDHPWLGILADLERLEEDVS